MKSSVLIPKMVEHIALLIEFESAAGSGTAKWLIVGMGAHVLVIFVCTIKYLHARLASMLLLSNIRKFTIIRLTEILTTRQLMPKAAISNHITKPSKTSMNYIISLQQPFWIIKIANLFLIFII